MLAWSPTLRGLRDEWGLMRSRFTVVVTALALALSVGASTTASAGSVDVPRGLVSLPARANRAALPVSLILSASVSPGVWLEGARVAVYSRHGAVAWGVTNSVGVLQVAVTQVRRDEWPLRIVTSGGTVNGLPFGGHLETYAWESGMFSLNLWPSAAARLIDRPGKNAPSRALWESGIEKVRGVLKVPDYASTSVLEGGNFYVDGGRVAAIVQALGGFESDAFDVLVGKVASASAKYEPKKKRNTSFLGLAPLAGTVTMAGPSMFGSTLGDSSIATPCEAITPDTPTSSGKSAGFFATVGVGAAAGLAFNVLGGAEIKVFDTVIKGFKPVTSNPLLDTMSGGYYAGTMFDWFNSSGESVETEQLTAIQDQLTCISAQVAAVEAAVQDLSNQTALNNIFGAGSKAAICAEDVAGSGQAFDKYRSMVRTAIPVSVPLKSAASPGSTSILVPTAYGANFTKGATVTGDGLAPLYLGGNNPTNPAQPRTTYPTSLNINQGSYTVEFLSSVWSGLGSAFSTSQLRGQHVSGTGVGVNNDGSPATVLGVSEFNGVTTLSLSASATEATYAGAALTIAGNNIVVSQPTAVTGGYSVSLSAPATGIVQSVSVAQSLDVTNALLPGTIDTFDLGYCVGVVNDALFATQSSGPTGLVAYLTWLTNGASGVGSTMTPAMLSQLQQFLTYWGLIEAQAFMLGAEYENFYGDVGGAVEQLSGFAPIHAEGSWPICWETADKGSACSAFSNLAEAWPDPLYSDEIGQTGSMVAVNAFPGGLSVPPDSTQAKLDRTETSLNPATWLALYWRLGGNCGPYSNGLAPNASFPTFNRTDQNLCPLNDASQFDNGAKWSGVAVNPKTVSANGTGTIYSPTNLYPFFTSPSDGSGQNDTGGVAGISATNCRLGRPYYGSARCQFNALGFNPGGYDSATTAFPNGSVTFTAGSPVVTTASPHGLGVGDAVRFWADGTGLPAGVAGATYYVVSAGLAVNTFEVATGAGGTPAYARGACPGNCYFYSTTPKPAMAPNLVENYRSPKVAHTRAIDLAQEPLALSPASTRMTGNQTGALLEGMQCGSPGTSTLSVSRNTDGSALFTAASTHGLALGDPVVFPTTAGGNLTAGTVYYVASVPTGYKFSLSTSAAGAANVPYKASASSISYATTQCPTWERQSADLLAKTSNDAGFMTADSNMTQYLWEGVDSLAECQNYFHFFYAQQYQYAYNSYQTTANGATSTSGQLRLPTILSSIGATDLRNTFAFGRNCSWDGIDRPHSCYSQGALRSEKIGLIGPRSDAVVAGFSITSFWPLAEEGVQACDTPFYYNSNTTNFINQTNLNAASYHPDAKRFDSFVLGRTWWPALGSLIANGPSAPITVKCADIDCDDYTFTNPVVDLAAPSVPTSVLVSPKAGGKYTVAWDQPVTAGAGRIAYYKVVATNGWTCKVANADGLALKGSKTFATCTGGTPTPPSVTVTAFNSIGISTNATPAVPPT